MKTSLKLLYDKLLEAFVSVVPIVAIVLLIFGLQFTSAFPNNNVISTNTLLIFIVSMITLALGMGLFTLGSEKSMTKVGMHIGSSITKKQSIVLIVIVSFGAAYSYFSANYVNGTSTSNIDLTSGKMIINFTDKNPNIVFSNVIPGPTSSVNDAVLSKSFVVSGTNTTDLKMEYKLELVVSNNEFDNNDIGYILIGKNNNNGAIVTNSKSSFTSSAISKISKGTNLKID